MRLVLWSVLALVVGPAVLPLALCWWAAGRCVASVS